MSKDILDMKRLPIDRVAARVVGKGVHWTPNKKVQTADSETPLPIADLRTLDPQVKKISQKVIGTRCGRLTILGLSAEKRGRWVVRCQCGMFTLRTFKALNNPKNNTDCCEQCRHLLHLKRSEIHRRTGKDVNWEDLE